MNNIRYIIPLVFFTLLMSLLGRSLFVNKHTPESGLIGKSLPELYLPNLITGNENINNNDFIGKPFLVNVWATWCLTCLAEHQFLLELKENKKINIIGINYKDTQTDALQWLKMRGNPYNTVLFDPSGKAAVALGIYGTPETFIVDKKGIIRFRYPGMINQQIWDKDLAPIIEELEKNEA